MSNTKMIAFICPVPILIPRNQYPALTLANEIYKEAGIRTVEIGTLLADRDPETRENRYPKLELVRFGNSAPNVHQ